MSECEQCAALRADLAAANERWQREMTSHEEEIAKWRADLAAAKAVAAEQALDEGLWCIAETAMEGHLQTALRRLAAAVEGDDAITSMREVEARMRAAEAERDVLRAELKHIATANPSEWDSDVRDQFQSWAQNRARAALTKGVKA